MVDDTRLIVTHEQLVQGWFEFRGEQVIHHDYFVLGKLPSGDYVVRAPAVTNRSGPDWTRQEGQ